MSGIFQAERINRWTLWMLVLCGLLAAASAGEAGNRLVAVQPRVQSWTVVVYGHADHNLSYSLALDLAEMSRARIGNHLRVIVVADWDASRKDEQTGRPFPTGTEWLRIRGNQQAPLRILQQPEQDFDDPQVLRTVVQQALRRFPARRYGLILWDHGGGWENGFGGDTQNGQRSWPGTMPVTAVAQAVREAIRARGIARLDFLAFDTCLMAGAEVLPEVVDLATVYLACAELDFGDGWDYERTLTWLSANSTRTAQEFARAEVGFWDAHHRLPADVLVKSHAAFDLTQWPAVAQAAQRLAQAIGSTPPAARLPLARALATTLPGYWTLAERQLNPQLRDLGQLCVQWSGF
ncbi:MAG: clostripain-related cysteine peptidase, partial [Planctomycetota bacterium]|nr:clostripain-related cysteine peptidase [Planctomycetota bacterium]